MTTVPSEIDVEAPISTAHRQRTQFEGFPALPSGTHDIRQPDDVTAR